MTGRRTGSLPRIGFIAVEPVSDTESMRGGYVNKSSCSNQVPDQFLSSAGGGSMSL
jgi:hypothetical protein